MAESIVSDVAVDLISKVGSLLASEVGLWWGVKDELGKLKRTVSTIKAVLLDAEEKSNHNREVKDWLGRLSEAMYDADDLLDEFSTEDLRQQVKDGSKISKKVRLFFSSSNQFAFGLKMGHKVRALRKRLDEIAADRKFHLEERPDEERRFLSNWRETHSSPPEVVIGREHDKEEIVRLLLSPDCDENVSVVSIVGIGGLGKTTVAQMVYNDERVKTHFELKIWVCVSDDFDVKLLVKKILESVNKKTPELDLMDPLRDILHENINGRKYLLVLDDVWNEDRNEWSRFKDLLVGGAGGSKIVITTRHRTVAETSRAVCIHELRGLSENESWSLFEQVAFKQGEQPNPYIEAMGKEIVAKCCGVPLAIKAIGGVLYSKDPNFDWVLFKENELSKIKPFEDTISRILMLSYNHIPSEYKPCFAFCSLYPKDFKFRVDELIQLWKAEGYVKSTNPNECLQDVGYRCFMDLYGWSFFQDAEKDDLGNIEYCKMRDLMHDLAISVAGNMFSREHSEMSSIGDKTRHMSLQVQPSCVRQKFSSMLRAKKIRTLLFLNGYAPYDYDPTIEAGIDSMFCNLRYLRVLNLFNMRILTLSNSIYKLKHLRYLDLSYNGIKVLPNSITNLLNLEVLNLKWCDNLMQLPDNISKLVNLANLDNSYCHLLTYMPKGIGKLTRLEKLPEFVIPRDHSISEHVGGLDELHSLNNLRGELGIVCMGYMKNAASEYREAQMCLKKKLEKLKLFWGLDVNCSANEVAIEEMGIEALCPHPNLKELEVWHYRGVKPPSWLPSISNLVSVTFDHCESMQWLPSLNQLLHLKKLKVRGLIKLERIDVENGGGSSLFFPSLTGLTLIHCPNLKGFQRLSMEELPCFASLSELKIRDCPALTCLPLFPELKQLTLKGVDMKSLKELLRMPKKSTSTSFSTLSHVQYLEISFMEDELLQCLPSLRSRVSSLLIQNCV